MTNLETVLALDEQGECLFRNNVYPTAFSDHQEAGAGSDELSELTEFRNEFLRAYSTSVSGVSWTSDDAKTVSITVKIGHRQLLPARIDPALVPESAAESLSRLLEYGYEIQLEERAMNSLQDMCRIQEEIESAARSSGSQVSLLFTPGYDSGQLTVSGTAQSLAATGLGYSLMSSRWDGLTVRELQGDPVVDEGRADSIIPPRGGAMALIRYPDGSSGLCTTGFRINTTALLTAGHCGGGKDGLTVVDPRNDTVLGVLGYSLRPANVDAQLIYGAESYSPTVWTGPQIATGWVPASGILNDGSLKIRDFLFMSGSVSGQATLEYVGSVGAPNSCLLIPHEGQLETWCHLRESSGTSSECQGGDSGAPVGLYEPHNNRVVAAGIHSDSALVQLVERPCWHTSMAVISYLYGGAVVG